MAFRAHAYGTTYWPTRSLSRTQAARAWGAGPLGPDRRAQGARHPGRPGERRIGIVIEPTPAAEISLLLLSAYGLAGALSRVVALVIRATPPVISSRNCTSRCTPPGAP